MNHSFLTAVMPFDADRANDVTKLLDGMGNPPRDDIRERLDATNCIHFMGIHVVPPDGKRAYLMVDASADGGDETALKRLEAAIGPELRALMLAAGIDMGGHGVAAMLRLHTIKVSNGWFRNPGIDFDGSPCMSVPRIKAEAELASEIAGLLDKPAVGLTALQRLQQVRVALWNTDAKKWAFFPEPAPFLLGVPPAPPLVLKSIVAALFRMIRLPLLAALAVGWVVLDLLSAHPDAGSLDWSVAAGVLTFALLLWWQGKPPPDQVTPSVIWISVELMFWPLLLAIAIVSGLVWWLVGAGWWLLVAFLGSALVFGLLPFGAYLILLRKEKRDVPQDWPPSAAAIGAMMQRESFTAQNLLAAVSIVKPGFIRKITLRFGLAAADVAAQFYSRPGFLTDIGVIHFARWFVVPGTDKLMFFSNYDGAWESYLEDFIERGYRGVTGIWSNTIGFPRTSKLLNGGARDGDRLRRWTRRQMFPVRFWYTAYPSLTLLRIRINAEIRQGLACVQTEEDAAKWLTLFGSTARPISGRRPRLTQPQARVPAKDVDQPDEGIEFDEAPTLLFGALSHLPFSTVLLVRLGDNAAAWLRELDEHVTFGRNRDAPAAMMLGLTRSGLERLKLDQDELATFPAPFLNGNQAPWRARALGDTGKNAPDRWKWGRPDGPVDAVIAIYAENAGTLQSRVDARIHEIRRCGHELVHCIPLRQLPNGSQPTEPFGYVDGVSQPIICGTRRQVPEDQLHQVVSPGEFILGYRDHQNFFPPSPTVPARTDPNRLLPDAPDTAGWPPSAKGPADRQGRRDLGRNGTFLVMRQLEQDVGKFDEFLRDAEVRFASDLRLPPRNPGVSLKDWLGAKIVGRWKDGSSLVRNPDGPAGGKSPGDNSFKYGTEDPAGAHCPLGAHIRRANPRDSFDPGADNEVQLAITNRHRILRVGRGYQPAPDENPGLLFMCLNVDIERQFEFVQQTWVLAPSFHGLEHERDTMLSEAANQYTIPMPGGPLRMPCMYDFVKVLGGAYFFVPGRSALQYLMQPR